MIRKIIKIDIVPFEKKYFSQLVDFVNQCGVFQLGKILLEKFTLN